MIEYVRNDVVIYTSNTPPSFPLYFNVAIDFGYGGDDIYNVEPILAP